MLFNFRIINHLWNFIRNGWYNRKPNDWKVYRAPLPVSAKTYASIKLFVCLFEKLISFPYHCLIWIDDDARTNWIACQSALERLLVVQRKPVERRFVVVCVACGVRPLLTACCCRFDCVLQRERQRVGVESWSLERRAEAQAKEALNALPKERYAMLYCVCGW